MKSLTVGVIGAGFVGGSVINGFSTESTEVVVVDPAKTDVTIAILIEQFEPDVVFICVPTPMNDDGTVHADIIYEVLSELNEFQFDGICVIKSTVTPEHLLNIEDVYPLRIVYNPEFLTEANANDDFINPNIQILGGEWVDCSLVEKMYFEHSKVKNVVTYKVDTVTASMVKYTMNSWLATKVIWFNQLKDVFDMSGAQTDWETFTDILKNDPRIGNTHMKVPGPDGSYGYGGHCFPKDVAAFLSYAKELVGSDGATLSLLKEASEINTTLRDDF